ncbi:MAG: hypothetical protein K6B67_06580 [Lachnospiraceae bacterium]|nr:hypothetical protein [Lachnospiraceae bacterium]
MEIKEVCIGHIAEIFLYEYYVAGNEEYKLKEENTYAVHSEAGKHFMENGDYEAALQEWIRAHEDNPVSQEALLNIVNCYIHLENIEKVLEYTKKSYDFCCTRAELAAFYRNLGFYYVSVYKPEVAAACYRYSTLFVESEAAENEIKFLEKALKKSMGKLTIEEMQKLLSENDIPLQANSVTLALIYKAGQEAAQRGLKSQAHDCFSMVYDLTHDEEVKNILQKMV